MLWDRLASQAQFAPCAVGFLPALAVAAGGQRPTRLPEISGYRAFLEKLTGLFHGMNSLELMVAGC
jgi:hypothetical protein